MKVDAILTADIHLRNDIPIARIDNFLAAQILKLQFIKKLAKTHKCPVLISGDIFHKAKSSPEIEAIAINNMPEFICIPGQHDLDGNVTKTYKVTSLYVLQSAGIACTLMKEKLNTLIGGIYGFPYGSKIESAEHNEAFKIALIHTMVHKDKPIHNSIESKSGLSLLKNTNFDLIVSGDNHQPFTVEYEGRLLVNCGSMMRTTAGQIEYEPVVWLWNKEQNAVTPVKLPITQGVISRVHLDKKEEDNTRMEALIEGMNVDYEIGMYFEKNMESYFHKNKTRKGVKDEIYKAGE